jgi:hypothetical protein
MAAAVPRILFLDDEPARAAAFLAARPGAVWVRTAGDCLERLAGPERWDEVHLDHDLGGETFVDAARDDCGMAVVRWLCRAPRPHLEATRFVVHSHNADAAFAMAFRLRAAGYRVAVRPFDLDRPRPVGPVAALLRLFHRAWAG